MNIHSGIVWIGVILSLSTGCSSQRGWAYLSTEPINQTPVLMKSVAVVPFLDKRPRENTNNIGLRLLPLMPFGWQTLNAPETIQGHIASGLWQFKPNEDMAKALALEVQNHHLFQETFFSFRESDGELVLRGSLLSTQYTGTVYSYGLSIYAPLLWVLGLPAGKIHNELSFELRLEERMSGQAIWTKRYQTDHDEGVYWVYAIPSDFWYDAMLRELMPTILSDMSQAARGSSQHSR